MIGKLRIPRPRDLQEVDRWRLALADGIAEALTQDDVLGTANQIIITKNADGTITLSLPQDIDTDADVEFDTLTLGDLTFGSVLFAGLGGLLSQDNTNFFFDNTTKSLLVGPDTDINCTFGRLKVGYMDDITFADIAYISHYDQFAWDTFALAQSASGAVYLNGNGSVNFHDKMLTYGRYYNSGGIDKRWHITGGLGDPVAFCLGGGLGSERVFFRQTGTSPTQLNLTTPYSNLQFNVDGQIGVGIVPPTSKLHVAGSIASAITTKTADYTATIEDSTIVIDGSANMVTITLPTAVGIAGRKYNIKCVDDTFACDVDGYGTETIDGELTQILNQWDNMCIQSDGTNWVIL